MYVYMEFIFAIAFSTLPNFLQINGLARGIYYGLKVSESQVLAT